MYKYIEPDAAAWRRNDIGRNEKESKTEEKKIWSKKGGDLFSMQVYGSRSNNRQ